MGGERPRGGMGKAPANGWQGLGSLRTGEPGLINKIQAALASGSSLFF